MNWVPDSLISLVMMHVIYQSVPFWLQWCWYFFFCELRWKNWKGIEDKHFILINICVNHKFWNLWHKIFVWVAVSDLGSNDVYGVWRINDEDHSFTTQPFKIRFAKQDVFLSTMVAFSLPVTNYEVVVFSYLFHFRFSILWQQTVQNGRDSYAGCYLLFFVLQENPYLY